MDYKIGDRVELVNDRGGKASIGDIGTIREVYNSNSFIVDFDSQSNYSCRAVDLKPVSTDIFLSYKDIKEGNNYIMVDNYGKEREVKLQGKTLINLAGLKNSNLHNARRLNYKFKELTSNVVGLPIKTLIYDINLGVNKLSILKEGDVLEIAGEKAEVSEEYGSGYICSNYEGLNVINHYGKKDGYKYNYAFGNFKLTASAVDPIYLIESQGNISEIKPDEVKQKTKDDIINELEEKLKEKNAIIEKSLKDNTEYKKTISELEGNIPFERDNAVKEYIKEQKKLLLNKKVTKKQNKYGKAWDNVIINDLLYRKINLSYDSKMPLLIKGPSGVGKTTFVKALAEDKGQEIVQFNFNGDTTVEHLLGHKILVGGDMLWEDGPLTDAVRNGKIFLADEINASSAEIQFILNGLLELKNGKLGKLSVQGNNGEVIEAHPNFRFFGTYNPGYLGTKNFGMSIMSRFISINVKHLSKDDEIKFLLNLFPKFEEEIRLLVDLEYNLRVNKNFSYDISTRDLIQTLMFVNGGFSLKESIEGAITQLCQLDLDVSELNSEIEKIIS